MKKLISLFMVAVFLFTFTACGAKKGTASKNSITNSYDETETLKKVEFDGKDDILNTWSEYLKVNEKSFSAIKWGSAYIKEFCKNPDISGYRRALAASETVSATIKNIEVPDLNVSEADLTAATEKGIDLSFVNMEFSGIKNNLYASEKLWESLSRDIATEAFWSYGIEYLEKTADVQSRQAQAYIDNLRHTTNYLLLLLGENSFVSAVCKDCPVIFGKDNEFIKNTADVEEKISASLDNLEACVSEQAKIESIQNANIYVMSNAVTTGKYDEVYSAALAWGKNKNIIPLPSWESLPVFYSYKSENSEQIKWTSAGDDLADVPPSLLVEYIDTSKADFIEYAEFLYSLGYTTSSAEGSYDGTEPMNLVFSLGDTAFSIDWKNNRATILIISADVILAPLWYYVYINT